MLVLASNSPRRKQLLALGGWDFTVLTPHIDEQVLPGERPSDYVRRLAEEKARAAWRLLLESPGRFPDHLIILAADTTVVWRDPLSGIESILGKPADAIEAGGMLRQLRGQMHQVLTGLAVFQAADGVLLAEVAATGVQMRNYSQAEIRAYIATGDPFDKAGAYAIQHPLFKPVQNLQGCYANVMGLPVCHTARLLSQMGCPPVSDIVQECQRALEFNCKVFAPDLRSFQNFASLDGDDDNSRLVE